MILWELEPVIESTEEECGAAARCPGGCAKQQRVQHWVPGPQTLPGGSVSLRLTVSQKQISTISKVNTEYIKPFSYL